MGDAPVSGGPRIAKARKRILRQEKCEERQAYLEMEAAVEETTKLLKAEEGRNRKLTDQLATAKRHSAKTQEAERDPRMAMAGSYMYYGGGGAPPSFFPPGGMQQTPNPPPLTPRCATKWCNEEAVTGDFDMLCGRCRENVDSWRVA